MDRTHSFFAADGHPLVGTFFEADGPAGVVVINSGTGIPRGFYRRYAAYLAEQGWSTLTYDYRGVGDSLQGSLKQSDATMTTWEQRDITSAIAEAQRLAPGLPLWVVAHSAGGQLFGMAEATERVAGVLAITVSSGTWWRMKPPLKWQCILLWYLLTPLATAALGYFPRGLLGLGENLPANVGREWGRWCRHPDYLGGHWSDEVRERYHALDLPWHSLAFADDPMSTRENVTALRRLYPQVDLTDEFLAPADIDMSSIGHMGFFKESARDTLWPRSLEILRGFPAAIAK